MRVPALGEAVLQLPWLSPCAASLIALARSDGAAAWPLVRLDPGAVLLILRQTSATSTLSSISFFPSLLADPAILDGALGHLQSSRGNGFVDWSQPTVRPVYQAALSYAQLTAHLAQHTGRADPDNAWVGGLLAPLGWLGVCAADPDQAAACLTDPALGRQPLATQQRHWGLDQAALARRLARRWQLPCWLAAVSGHLGLPVETAQVLGADPDLFRLVQLAIGLIQEQGAGLHLAVGSSLAETAGLLGLSAGEMAALKQEAAALIRPGAENTAGQRNGSHHPSPAAPPLTPALEWLPPASEPLLPDLLRLASQNRRLGETPLLQRLESDVDDLHQALETRSISEAERLREQKLTALAELAAGAGHEINNPLAVISGQAQYLLNHLGPEDDSPAADHAGLSLSLPDVRKALRTIVHQTQRIHQILTDLMQFARPSRSGKEYVDLQQLVREVAQSLSDLAIQRRVQLIYPLPGEGDARETQAGVVQVEADPRQLQTALTCLVRNAIEAAPAEGWARVSVESAFPDRVEVLVEDNGKGPSVPQPDLLFTPFYSGRPAGRGRGLGLPIAWRLAREQGGDVRFVDLSQGPTRFVLSLPRTADGPGIPVDCAGEEG